MFFEKLVMVKKLAIAQLSNYAIAASEMYSNRLEKGCQNGVRFSDLRGHGKLML